MKSLFFLPIKILNFFIWILIGWVVLGALSNNESVPNMDTKVLSCETYLSEDICNN